MKVKRHIIGACGECSESSIELNTYMHKVKYLVCVGVVIAQDHFPFVDVIGRQYYEVIPNLTYFCFTKYYIT